MRMEAAGALHALPKSLMSQVLVASSTVASMTRRSQSLPGGETAVLNKVGFKRSCRPSWNAASVGATTCSK